MHMQLLGRELRLKRIDSNAYEIARWAMNKQEIVPKLKGIEMIRINLKTGDSTTITSGD